MEEHHVLLQIVDEDLQPHPQTVLNLLLLPKLAGPYQAVPVRLLK
jgi:hypothetical protein